VRAVIGAEDGALALGVARTFVAVELTAGDVLVVVGAVGVMLAALVGAVGEEVLFGVAILCPRPNGLQPITTAMRMRNDPARNNEVVVSSFAMFITFPAR